MKSEKIISQLEKNINVFRELLNVPKEIIQWKVQPEKWNLLEITCHLYDEEREDFRARLKHIFETPNEPMPPIDPPGWVLSRNYAARNFSEMLNKFLDERRESLKWLKSLDNPPYDNFYQHPKIGPISAKMILANWLAHDYLHFRQITKVKYDYLADSSGEKLDYAGNW